MSAVDHVVLQCPNYRPPYGLHGLTVLEDETTEWLLNKGVRKGGFGVKPTP